MNIGDKKSLKFYKDGEAEKDIAEFSKESLDLYRTAMMVLPNGESHVVLEVNLPEEYFKPDKDVMWNVYAIGDGKQIHVFLAFKFVNAPHIQFNFHLLSSSERDRKTLFLAQEAQYVSLAPKGKPLQAMVIGQYDKSQVDAIKFALKTQENIDKKKR